MAIGDFLLAAFLVMVGTAMTFYREKVVGMYQRAFTGVIDINRRVNKIHPKPLGDIMDKSHSDFTDFMHGHFFLSLLRLSISIGGIISLIAGIMVLIYII